MYYVYLLRSEYHSAQTYVGYTGDLRQRLTTHNAGGSPHTAKYRPWRLENYLGFAEKSKATAFEKYLKSHSGKAFARNVYGLRTHKLGKKNCPPLGQALIPLGLVGTKD